MAGLNRYILQRFLSLFDSCKRSINYYNMLRLLVLGYLCVGSFGFVAKAPMPNGRIVGGVETTIEAHPHQLSFQRYGNHVCGASIIGRSWAVTAAHCVTFSSAGWTVRAGSKFVNEGELYTVKRIVRHPRYSVYLDYDVALIEIDGEFPRTKTINQIEMATVELPTDTIVNVTGWGNLVEGGPSPDILMQVSVPIIDRKACTQAYTHFIPVTERMICTGVKEGGKGQCNGDSGGPLTAGNVLYGIVSWGEGCARPGSPSVLTNVASVRSWIRSITGI